MFRKVIEITASILLGLVFIVSAWFKMEPIYPFEFTIVGSSPVGWQVAPFLARLIIALEFSLGVLLVGLFKTKQTAKYAAILLSIFSIHLILVLISQGNKTDCGCMGSLIALTPLQGLIKNIIMLVLTGLLFKSEIRWLARTPRFVPVYLFVIATALVFVRNPVDLFFARQYLNRPFVTFNLDLDTVYNAGYPKQIEPPARDVRSEKCILAFVSSTCEHCKLAGKKIGIMARKNPSIPFYLFINGDDNEIESFLDFTQTGQIPHSKLNGPVFVQLAGLNLPVIFYYNKGKIDQQVNYITLEQYHIETWLSAEN